MRTLMASDTKYRRRSRPKGKRRVAKRRPIWLRALSRIALALVFLVAILIVATPLFISESRYRR